MDSYNPASPTSIGGYDAQGKPLPAKAIPASPQGITPDQSEVMVGQKWVRLVGLGVALAAAGVGAMRWLTPELVSILTNPDFVGMVIIPGAGLIIWAANEILGRYIKKGRENNGQALSPLVKQ